MVTVQIKTNINKVIKDLKKDLKKYDDRSIDAINLTAEAGKKIAFNLSPYASGKTARAVKLYRQTKNRKRAMVIAGNGHPNKKWRGSNFNLSYWMYKSDKALSHPWRSGTPRYMQKASDKMYKELGIRFNWAINALTK